MAPVSVMQPGKSFPPLSMQILDARPPLTRGLVNGVDWGRESLSFSGNLGNFETFSLPPALRATY